MATNSVPRKRRVPSGRRPPDDVVELRRSEVEEALQRPNGWTAKFRAAYMKKWDIGLQTMWDDRTAVLRAWDREVNDEPRRHVRAALVKRTQYAGGLAEGRERYTEDGEAYSDPDVSNILRAVSIEAKLTGSNAPEEVLVEHSGSVELRGVDAVLADPIAHARAILDPQNIAWARAVLTAQGEQIPNVIDVPALDAAE